MKLRQITINTLLLIASLALVSAYSEYWVATEAHAIAAIGKLTRYFDERLDLD